MFGNRNVITKLMPIQTRICWGFAFTLSARTSSAPIRPKTAPEAPSVGVNWGLNQYTKAEPASAESR